MAEASATTTSAGNTPTKALPPTSSRLSEKDKEREKTLPQLIEQLRARVKDIEPLPDEPQYFLLDETLVRFIRAREYSLKDAEKQLRHTIDWRRKHRPLNTNCRACLKKPGLHSIRQVGFDLEGRPVIYTCFEQCSSLRISIDATLEHMTMLCEDTVAAFREGAPPSWTWVIDCHGITLGCCNPTMAQEVLGLLGLCYPEYLHRVIVTSHNTVFHNFWKMIKVFVDPKTIEKVRLVRKKEKLMHLFESMFSKELTDWLFEEIRLNDLSKIPEYQKRFYLPPPAGVTHDPRGTPTYIQQCIVPFAEKHRAEQQLLQAGKVVPHRVHRPHPNIVSHLLGERPPSVISEEETANIPLITPAFSFIRDVNPFRKDSDAEPPTPTNANGKPADADAGRDGGPIGADADKCEHEVSDDEPEDNASVSRESQGDNSSTIEVAMATTSISAPAPATTDAENPEAPKDVTDTVLDTISSAKNKITNFFGLS